jgi:hypothetical protein
VGTMAKVALPPWRMVCGAYGAVVPPDPAEGVIVYVGRAVNAAVTVLLPVIVIVIGFVVPVTSPDQPVKV